MPELEDLQRPMLFWIVKNDNLWSTFDISVGHDDGFEVPSYEAVVEQLENQYGRLGSQHR
jgi:hypothetical protein